MLLSVNDVGLPIAVTLEPTGIPVPVTYCPTIMPVVLATVTVAEPLVVEPPVRFELAITTVATLVTAGIPAPVMVVPIT